MNFTSPRPEFGDPPVTEVAIGIQFAPIQGLTLAHLGLLWNRFRDRYPRTEEHQPLSRWPINSELLDGRASLQLVPVLPRLWFLNASDTELVQVQDDRFVVNWRKREGHDYPRFEVVLDQFRSAFGDFVTFLLDEGLPEPVTDHCEVTYVNTISLGNSEKDLAAAKRYFNLFADRPDSFLPDPSLIAFGFTYAVTDEEGRHRGVLTVEATPVLMSEQRTPACQLRLIARGNPFQADEGGSTGFFSIGREVIVRGFSDLTSQWAHEKWRRKK